MKFQRAIQLYFAETVYFRAVSAKYKEKQEQDSCFIKHTEWTSVRLFLKLGDTYPLSILHIFILFLPKRRIFVEKLVSV